MRNERLFNEIQGVSLMRLVVFGMGYLGVTHAACMAELGHEVLGVDTNTATLAAVAAGGVPFYEPELPGLVKGHVASGRLKVTASYDEAAAWGETFFIAVGTPQERGSVRADLSYVNSVVDELVPRLRRDSLIIGKSTVPVGTCARLAERASSLAGDVDVEVAWNPEFLREGYAVKDTMSPDRIVVGTFGDGAAEAVCRSIYASIIDAGCPFIVTDTATAELVKISANAFLATKISFINAIAEICELVGADVKAVADAIGYDARIGRRYLNAGIGFGGGCLPKDIRAFMARAGELGRPEALAFLKEVDNVNMRRRTRMVEITRSACDGTLLGRNVAILGAAFKPDSDDVRDSPALNIAGQLQLQGAYVTVYDPKAMANSQRLFPTLKFSASTAEACVQADAVLVLTEWDEFRKLQPQDIGDLVRRRVIIDGRMCLTAESWRRSGWTYRV